MTAACPRCGSTDPAVREPEDAGISWKPCPDPWHDVELVPDLTTPISGIVHRPTGADPALKVDTDKYPVGLTVDTGADDLAARLDEWANRLVLPVSTDVPVSPVARVADLRAAAARLRELEAATADAVRELEGAHYPDPTLPGFCIVCGTADGSWPCTARMAADDLRAALDRWEQTR